MEKIVNKPIYCVQFMHSVQLNSINSKFYSDRITKKSNRECCTV